MNYAEVIESQVNLLVQVNQNLADHVTTVAAQEIRENVRLIMKLAEVADLEIIEFRVKEIEECLLGSGENEGLVKDLIKHVKSLEINQEDHEERLNDLEARTDQEAWDIFEEDDSLPDFPYEETLMGLRARVEKLEGTALSPE